MHDLDDLLSRRQTAHHFLSNGTFSDTGDKILDDLKVNVGLKQRQANLAHGDIDISFR